MALTPLPRAKAAPKNYSKDGVAHFSGSGRLTSSGPSGFPIPKDPLGGIPKDPLGGIPKDPIGTLPGKRPDMLRAIKGPPKRTGFNLAQAASNRLGKK